MKTKGINADIFTFMQRLPESKPKFSYFMEWDNVAAIPVTTYDNWLKNQVAKNSRKKINYAERQGVELRQCEFNDDFVKGILEIYHETPILQGKPNRQYRTSFETAKKLNSTFLDRAVFFGAFLGDELIAYIKLVSTKNFIRTMGILTKIAHREKGPMNLLVAKAVEVCAEQNKPYLMYAKYNYGKIGSQTLMEFKKNMGFEHIILPRYYIPLTTLGKTALALKLHNGVTEMFPEKILRYMLDRRSSYYEKKYAQELKGLKS